MAPARASMTRNSSLDSSVGSNINVSGVAEDSGSEQPSTSSPPTSVSDNHSMQSTKVTDDMTKSPPGSASRRSMRARSSVGTYNLKELSEKTLPEAQGGPRKASGLSGRTLVDKDDDDEEAEAADSDSPRKAARYDSEGLTGSPNGKLPPRIQRKPSVKDHVKKAVGNAKTALGKRTHDMMEAGKRALGLQAQEESPRPNKYLKELNMGKGGVLDELDLDEEFPAPRPTKRAKTNVKTLLQEAVKPLITGSLQKTSDGKKVKKWMEAGLYVGQETDFDPEHPRAKKLQKKRPASAMSETAEEGVKKRKLDIPLPMFGYADKSRDFTIPYDVFAPSLRKGDEKPKDWKQLNTNRLIGDAAQIWKKKHDSEKLESSLCICRRPREGELGCDEDCLNRVMKYECNDQNCGLKVEECSNRPFAELAKRLKKGGAYDIGVEVVKTENRGFGVRASRSFKPGQIIMEYTGEIIDEEECQRRMRELYKDKQCYYLMEMENNLIIDGTKGSMARFINHSCAPNCTVEMIKVNGKPRMAIFAGLEGIMTGEELTYDYNFDNFSEAMQKCYCGSQHCRGSLSRRLTGAETKKKAKEEAERMRIAQELAQKQAEAEARKKKDKTDPSNMPGWRGWVPVDDPAVKARLKEEKRIAEEKAKNSPRALRLAKRHGDPSASAKLKSEEPPTPKKKASPRRRKTVATTEELNKEALTQAVAEDDEEAEPAFKATHLRRTSTGSRFTESLDLEQRPASRQSVRSRISKKTTISVQTSAQVQGDTIAEDEDITVTATAVMSPNRKSLSRSSSKKTKKSILDDDEDKDDEDESVAKPKRNSILSSVTAVVNRGGQKVFGSTSGKLRQSTLNFAKKV